eukprot:CAMPEP_0169087918 /NCGR_PEP_ID=MMETSP1015-20121227/14482_1 /TAXON_ID=342587 /ORGANISM="Karlodinium micrum, Strain CCMP2283" /LENGTH=99 /DNA_ID=CAMNT_0009148169 /DNA_START=258 /DNA_END=558 /DNA_ORIENTATION=-
MKREHPKGTTPGRERSRVSTEIMSLATPQRAFARVSMNPQVIPVTIERISNDATINESRVALERYFVNGANTAGPNCHSAAGGGVGGGVGPKILQLQGV